MTTINEAMHELRRPIIEKKIVNTNIDPMNDPEAPIDVFGTDLDGKDRLEHSLCGQAFEGGTWASELEMLHREIPDLPFSDNMVDLSRVGLLGNGVEIIVLKNGEIIFIDVIAKYWDYIDDPKDFSYYYKAFKMKG